MLGGTLGGATGCKDCSKHGGWVKKESSEKNKVSAHVAHEKPPVHWWVEDVHSASQKTGGKGIIRYSKKSRRTGEETRRTRASNLPTPSTVPYKRFSCASNRNTTAPAIHGRRRQDPVRFSGDSLVSRPPTPPTFLFNASFSSWKRTWTVLFGEILWSPVLPHASSRREKGRNLWRLLSHPVPPCVCVLAHAC